jgi:hypothetical protein
MLKKSVYAFVGCLFLSGTALGQTQRYSWDNYGVPGSESSITLEPSNEHFANLIITNNLSTALVNNNFEFVMEDLTLRIYYDDKRGRIPDVVSITLSPGFYAVPNINRFEIEEGETIIIEIHRMLFG